MYVPGLANVDDVDSIRASLQRGLAFAISIGFWRRFSKDNGTRIIHSDVLWRRAIGIPSRDMAPC